MAPATAIVQARMNSSRLPGKILEPLDGRPALDMLVRRVRLARTVSELVIATTDDPLDDPVASLADEAGIACFRGGEEDVLGRYVGAAALTDSPIIVRITGDCPLIDPGVLDQVVDRLAADASADYASNVEPRRYPWGLDVEAFTRSTLDELDGLSRSADEREHVTLSLYTTHADRFRRVSVIAPGDDSDLRWTLDYPEDLAFLQRITTDLGLGSIPEPPPYRTLVDWCRRNPEASSMNAHRSTWSAR